MATSTRGLGRDRTFGVPDAPITVVMWADYQCPFSKRVQPTVDQLRKNHAPHDRVFVGRSRQCAKIAYTFVWSNGAVK